MPVFSDVTFSLSPGDILTILGANGAGKSTLLNCMVGVYPLRQGRVLVNGMDIRSFSVEKMALELAYVPQVQSTAFDYSVRDYVVMGRAPHIGLMHTPDDDEYLKVDEALERMNLSHLAAKSCQNISGGERQQMQIARALVQQSRIILMDEPTNHLDYGNQVRILKTIVELSEKGYIVILTTHIPDHAILLDGIAAILQPGGSMRVGPAGQIVNEKNMTSIYDTDLRIVYVPELERMACLVGSVR
jgi:iron complex transport system ATP-binding protein